MKITIVLILLSISTLCVAQKQDTIVYPDLHRTFKTTWQTPTSPKMFTALDPQKLPLFCRLEYRWEIKSRLAPRFRLGSLEYVNSLEGVK
jgi:hypothetical protein